MQRDGEEEGRFVLRDRGVEGRESCGQLFASHDDRVRDVQLKYNPQTHMPVLQWGVKNVHN